MHPSYGNQETVYSRRSNEEERARLGNPMKSHTVLPGFAVSVSGGPLFLYRFVLIRKIAHDFSRCHAVGTPAIPSWNFAPAPPPLSHRLNAAATCGEQGNQGFHEKRNQKPGEIP